MRLDEQSEKDLADTNKRMTKAERDMFKCPSCKAQQTKGYCGRCDNFTYRCYHKDTCKRKDWGNVACAC